MFIFIKIIHKTSVFMKNKACSLSARWLLIISSLLFFTACSKKLHFATSTVVPAADGTVKYKKDNNGNYAIDVKIEHLADPKKLDPPKNTYILWMQTDQNGAQNLGQISSSSGWFSSKLKASLHAVTPYKPNGFFITAEDNATATYPGQEVVLKTQ